MDEHAAQRIARNTAWFTIGSILQKLISFGYFTVVAMAFGQEGTGQYFFALAFTALFAVAADWGIAPVLTRETAKDREGTASYVVSAFALRAMSTVVVVGVVTLFSYVLNHDDATRQMIGLATVVMVLDSIHLGCYAVLRGLQRVSYEAIGLAVGQLVLAVTGIGILVLLADLRINAGATPLLTIGRPIAPIWLLVPYLVASIAHIAIAVFGTVRERAWRARARRSLGETWRSILAMATPFAIAGGLARVYTYMDTFLLRTLLAASGVAVATVGIYSVAFKITFAFQFIPLAFMGALYPAMSALATRNRQQLSTLFTQALRVLWIVALPIAFGIGTLAYRIIPLLYGEAFRASVVPLIILIAALPFIFANFPAGNLLNAIDRQTLNTKLLAIATVVNVIANIVLIPPFAAVGAAISALVSSVTLFAVNLVALRRNVHYAAHAVLDPFLRTTAACLVMTAGIALLHELPLAALIGVGVVLYVVALVLLGGISFADIQKIRRTFRPASV
ncbi:MAG: flippase [bacterium]|nr:flippase [bacterium]